MENIRTGEPVQLFTLGGRVTLFSSPIERRRGKRVYVSVQRSGYTHNLRDLVGDKTASMAKLLAIMTANIY